MSIENASLDGLPDELVLEILHYLHTIRSYETQSTAFRNKEKEKTRQYENHVLQLALHDLCLTSRRLRRIATPILYASFTGSATRYGMEPLRLFYERVSASHASGCNYIECLQYVEIRLSDYLGNSLHADMRLPDAVHMVTSYFYMLADVIKRAPNLQHLSVACLENDEVSLWKYITPGQNTRAGHGFDKLRTLCLQMHIDGSVAYGDLSFDRVCSVVSTAPLLSDFRASGVITCGPAMQSSELGSFSMLKRLEITECVVEIELVAQVLSVCEELRHVVCVWAFLDGGIERPSDLYSGLLRHSDTLKSLHLDLREVRFANDLDVSQCLGTLRPFKCLETLIISENCLLGSPSPLFYSATASPLPRISELLPPCLASFALLLIFNDHNEAWYSGLDDSIGMWGLVADCKSPGPNLEDISIQGDLVLPAAPDLTKAFSEIGVHFEVKPP